MTPARERIVHFGEQGNLLGILSTPRDPVPDAPHLVLVNAGVVHRIGPNRLYVDIARALSASGYGVLRFDLAGLGDSENTGGGLSLSDAAVADVRAAFDYLERTRKVKRFIVGGLCSGANYSVLTAFKDERVAGAVLIDPSVSRTFRSLVIHYFRRVKHLDTWSLVVRMKHPVWKRAGQRLGFDVPGVQRMEDPEFERTAIPDFGPETRRALEQTIARGTELLVVFTGGLNGQYNYKNQLYDLLPGFDFKGRLQLEFLRETDHAVSDSKSREGLVRTMETWMRKCFRVAAREEEAS